MTRLVPKATTRPTAATPPAKDHERRRILRTRLPQTGDPNCGAAGTRAREASASNARTDRSTPAIHTPTGARSRWEGNDTARPAYTEPAGALNAPVCRAQNSAPA